MKHSTVNSEIASGKQNFCTDLWFFCRPATALYWQSICWTSYIFC